MWIVYKEHGALYIANHAEEKTRVFIEDTTDTRFARSLCHILNGTPSHKLHRDMEEMDLRGVQKVGY